VENGLRRIRSIGENTEEGASRNRGITIVGGSGLNHEQDEMGIEKSECAGDVTDWRTKKNSSEFLLFR